MNLVIERAKPATRFDLAPENGQDTGDAVLSFDVAEYPNDTTIARPEDIQSQDMFLLAEGCIRVAIQCGIGESTIHVIRPGDMIKLGAIVNIATLDAGAPSEMRTLFHVEGGTRLFRLKRGTIEKMFRSESKLAYTLIQHMMRKWHETLVNINRQCGEIRNYIYG